MAGDFEAGQVLASALTPLFAAGDGGRHVADGQVVPREPFYSMADSIAVRVTVRNVPTAV